MSHLYVDESIHERGDFIVIAAVYSKEPLDQLVAAALAACGFAAGRDEFKSCLSMNNNDQTRELRQNIQTILWEHCRVAYAICTVAERDLIADHLYQLAGNLVWDPPIQGGTIYFDEGIKPATHAAPAGWSAIYRCNSKAVGGIQVADCAAHTYGTILLDDLGITKKIVPIENYVEPEVELRWLLWSWLRDVMASNIPAFEPHDDGYHEPMMLAFGIHVSELCPEKLRDLGGPSAGVWVGCIH